MRLKPLLRILAGFSAMAAMPAQAAAVERIEAESAIVDENSVQMSFPQTATFTTIKASAKIKLEAGATPAPPHCMRMGRSRRGPIGFPLGGIEKGAYLVRVKSGDGTLFRSVLITGK